MFMDYVIQIDCYVSHVDMRNIATLEKHRMSDV